MRIRTFGLGVVCSAALGATWFAGPAWAQPANPLVDLNEIIAPQDETAAPADHMMASACFAELRAVYPEEKHDFSNLVFTQSKVLGAVVRIDYRIAGTQDKAAPDPAPINRLVCYRREGDAKLEMYTIRGVARSCRSNAPSWDCAAAISRVARIPQEHQSR